MPSFIRPLFQSFHLERTGASQPLSYLLILLSFTWPVRVLRALFYPNFYPIQVVLSTRRPQMNTKSFIALIFLALASSVNAVPTPLKSLKTSPASGQACKTLIWDC
ncbi:hypothetical protein BGY98DRAFT_999921 [Russula aff. rugulosa BPL654]|nr:hypothetical protein BGY98DRAFT_999921 [Russula aff. rugulosa BPL654]